jgi:AcrR family transcriptional regulator
MTGRRREREADGSGENGNDRLSPHSFLPVVRRASSHARGASAAKAPIRRRPPIDRIAAVFESWFSCYAICAFPEPMPYRRTENVERRLAARRASIITAAREAASEAGMAAVQIAPIARRAGIAAGTVYRYFPGKTDLVAALLAEITAREIGALRRAGDEAPGPLSALCCCIMTFADRALRNRRLTFAAIAEPIDAELDPVRVNFRKSLAGEFAKRVAAAVSARYLPDQDSALGAAAVLGLLVEGLIGPLAPQAPGREREIVQTLTLTALRALGLPDARARGLVVQTTVSNA